MIACEQLLSIAIKKMSLKPSNQVKQLSCLITQEMLFENSLIYKIDTEMTQILN